MTKAAMKVLFVDRDGTLIEEPPDEQVDSLAKIRFLPDVFASLQRLTAAGYRLVMVTNQDGLGTASFPRETFEEPQQFVLRTFASQGLVFDEIFVCPHRPGDGCDCRKPSAGHVGDFFSRHAVDMTRQRRSRRSRYRPRARAQSRPSRPARACRRGGRRDVAEHRAQSCSRAARRVRVRRKETRIAVSVDLDAEGPIRIATGHGFFDHMLEQLARHGGFALDLRCDGDLHVDEHHTVEDCALALGEVLRRALGDKRGIQRYGFLLPMDEARVQVAIDLSGRAYGVFEGKLQPAGSRRTRHRAGAALLPFAG